jgi:hypothetical protein
MAGIRSVAIFARAVGVAVETAPEGLLVVVKEGEGVERWRELGVEGDFVDFDGLDIILHYTYKVFC